MKKVSFLQKGTVGLSLIVPVGETGRLTTTVKGKKRQIRHCLNETSPFVEEQTEFATVAPLVIKKGRIDFYEGQDDVSIEFMKIHPLYGVKWAIEDAEQNAVSALEIDDLITELKAKALETQKSKNGLYKLQALASVIKGSYTLIKDKSPAELRQVINQSIEVAPRTYTNDQGEPELFKEDILRKFMAIQAIDRELVKVSPDGRKVKWGKGNKTICDVPAGRKPKEYFAEYLGTDDGMLVVSELEKFL